MVVSSANSIRLANLFMLKESSFIYVSETVKDPISNPMEHHASHVPI